MLVAYIYTFGIDTRKLISIDVLYKHHHQSSYQNVSSLSIDFINPIIEDLCAKKRET